MLGVSTILVSALLAVGCGESGGLSEPERRALPIKNGKVDTKHKAVVTYVNKKSGGGIYICSGTLVAKNLVLTARHCIAPLKKTASGGAVQCGRTEFGSPYATSHIVYVSTDDDIRRQGGFTSKPTFSRTVTRIDVPSSSKMACQSDIALLTLDKNVPGSEAKPITPRLGTAVQKGETFTAVGYGSDGGTSGSTGVRRKRSGLQVQAVCNGKKVCQPNYNGTNNYTYMGETEFLTDGAPCRGDSGGAALDSNGETFGVVSRGTSGCIWEVFVSTHAWRNFLRTTSYRAAAAGGYRTPGWANLPKDKDSDGIHDKYDNCPSVKNTSQIDKDGNGTGEKCQDDDNDGKTNDVDNCPMTPNAGQADLDGDKEGDACDSDIDGDGVENGSDNCESAKNKSQADLDGDKKGDACDSDLDGDSVSNGSDNCPGAKNPSQADADSDGKGDLCDDDDDGDSIPDDRDNCPLDDNPGQEDLDGDGKGDACEDDADGDGVPAAADNCPKQANREQRDSDRDGLGDRCDPDTDGDGTKDGEDNCPLVINADQGDVDGDGRGDICDSDTDGDGVDDMQDNCPMWSNPTQADDDDDGVGDRCEDDDGDGIPNRKDECPGSSGVSTNDAGCPVVDDSPDVSGSTSPDAGAGGDTGGRASGRGCSAAGSQRRPGPLGAVLFVILSLLTFHRFSRER